MFEAYQRWQAELERQPVEFLGRRRPICWPQAELALAAYLGVAAADVVYFPNPTTAINMVARNVARLARRDRAVGNRQGSPLRLRPGDEILTTDHEYGAMDRTWRYICDRIGARYVQRPIPLPMTTHADFVDRFWAGVTERTRIIFISHITSPTALNFPDRGNLPAGARGGHPDDRGRRARAGPGAAESRRPGRRCGADIYTGACHKWLCAPKGAAFLYARPEVQPWLEPLVVSWGWETEKPGPVPFVDWHEWQGTRDIAAYLSVPAAIEFQQGHDWDAVRRRCHALAVETRARIVG